MRRRGFDLGLRRAAPLPGRAQTGEEALLRSNGQHVPEIAEWIEKNHRGHDQLVRLLGAVAATCDGQHVHGLRFALEELRAELESHILYEARVVFPLLAESLPG